MGFDPAGYIIATNLVPSSRVNNQPLNHPNEMVCVCVCVCVCVYVCVCVQ